VTRRARSVCLVKNGEVRFSVNRLPRQGAEKILEPADELITHLEKCLGGAVPQYDERVPVQLDLHHDVGAALDREESVIRATARRVELRARTVEAMFHAVYEFLERFLGVRWLWPGPSGRVTPRLISLSLPLGTIRQKPDFAWRSVGVGGAIYGYKGGQDFNTTMHACFGLPLSYQKEFALWCRRNRFGGPKILSGHRMIEILPPERYGKSHPEYYALADGQRDCAVGDGKHGNMPCLTNPEVIRLTADYACAQFAADSRLDACSIALNDGGSPCECERCQAVDARAGAENVAALEYADALAHENALPTPAQRSVTDRVFWNHQQVAARVAERYPDRKLLTLIYANFRLPPVTNRLPENVIGQYCVLGHQFWNDEVRRTELGRLRRLHESVPSLGIYEYYANGVWPDVHRLFPHIVEDSVRGYYGAGARYFETQPSTGFATNGLNLFALGRLLWNRKADAAEVLDDYCRSGFGPAAALVKRFLTAFAERWRGARSATDMPPAPYPGYVAARLYSERFLQARKRTIEKAAARVKGDPALSARVRFLARGLRYTSLYCRAARETLALFRACGSPETLQDVDPTAKIRAAARRALRAWSAYWAFVRTHLGTFVFGDFWALYHPGKDGERDPILVEVKRLARPAS